MDEVEDNVKIEDKILATRRMIIAQIEREIQEHQQIIMKHEKAMALLISKLDRQRALLNMELGSQLARELPDAGHVDCGNKLSNGDTDSHEQEMNIE
jgi:hypothetical protein